MAVLVLCASLILQIIAAVLALRLIRLTGRGAAWLGLAGAILLMAVRRSITLYQAWLGERTPDFSAEFVALVISILMLFGVASIAPLIHMISRSEEVARLTKQAERSEALFRGVIEQTFQFIGLMSVDGTLLEANRSSLEAAGVEPEDVLNRPFWETVWWSHSPEMQLRLKRAIQNAACGEFDRFDTTHPAADGSLIYIDFSIKPLFDSAGNVIYLIPEGRDVTELKTDQEKLRRLNEKLRQSNQDLDDFAYSVSHDLKAPLRAIDHLSTWIVQDAGEFLPEDAARHLQQIRDRVLGMGQLLDELLAYSLAGRERGELVEVDVAALVEEIVALLSVPAEFTIETDGDLPVFETFKAPFATCLRNLIDNAVKHHDRPDGTVRVSVADQGKFLDFCVADDGPGIDPRFHDRIFKIFRTLRKKPDTDSTGVGLANVKKIAVTYGGDAWVESELGQGSRFIFRWPRKIDAEVDEVMQLHAAAELD